VLCRVSHRPARARTNVNLTKYWDDVVDISRAFSGLHLSSTFEHSIRLLPLPSMILPLNIDTPVNTDTLPATDSCSHIASVDALSLIASYTWFPFSSNDFVKAKYPEPNPLLANNFAALFCQPLTILTLELNTGQKSVHCSDSDQTKC
jgi:hypothetical protein